MTLQAFESSLGDPEPPAGLGPALGALWHEARGEWDAAHGLAQSEHDRDGAWVHAYLHRVEGDPGNAAYWYRRAGRPVSDRPLREEWREIVATLLAGDRA
ncbi:MAG TPA: hypothetical protein VFG47_10940 [Geminicoccaceae bacterium]|nr:hypothetical protein [Geminicoccaceae bacterium]